MGPIKIELPADTPEDLRDEFVGTLEQMGAVYEPGTQRYDLGTVMLILAGISASADLLAVAALLKGWLDKAGRRGVPIDKVTIVAGDQSIKLKNTDSQTLARLLEGLRES
jgi:hypothetical protein